MSAVEPVKRPEFPMRYRVRQARSCDDFRAVRALRHRVFMPANGATGFLADQDRFDDICTSVLIEEVATGVLVCCYRFLPLPSGAEIDHSYSAQFYDLSKLENIRGPMVEIGRFCLNPDFKGPEAGGQDILRLAWAEMTRYVDKNAVEMMFGCSSFKGVNPRPYHAAFGELARRYLAPTDQNPSPKASEIYAFSTEFSEFSELSTARKSKSRIDRRAAMLNMPPLLRSYIQMGGWVSDHAVIDRPLQTLHVFTGLAIASIPPARQRLLRALAQ